jgi:hypothetical protein
MWDAILGYMVGGAICVIFTILVFNIGIKEQIAMMIACFGWIGGLTVWYANFMARNKKEEMKEIRQEISFQKIELIDALRLKADIKDIEKVSCRMNTMNETLEYMAKSQEEQHTTIDNIYNFLLKKGK